MYDNIYHLKKTWKTIYNESIITEDNNLCWDGYEMYGMKNKDGKNVPNCVKINETEYTLNEDDITCYKEIEEAEYKGRKVKLNKPMKGDVKKYKVYVKNKKGNVVKVNFGDPNMEIKRDNPERRKSFRARHNCDNPGPKDKARYWSCKFWSNKNVSDLLKEKELIKGGLADNKDLNDILKHHFGEMGERAKTVSFYLLKDQLEKGIKVEMEHTDDPEKAKEIAKDHLWEDPDYYTKLATIEPEHEELKEEDNDEGDVFVYDPTSIEDQIDRLIDQYNDEEDITPQEIISDEMEEINIINRKLKSLKSKYMIEKDHFNIAWSNANKLGQSSKSIGKGLFIFKGFDELYNVKHLKEDEKLLKILKELESVGGATLFNIRNPSKQIQKNKKMTVSPSMRDDYLRMAVFGKNYNDAKDLLINIHKKYVNNQDISITEIKELFSMMNGPIGEFLKYLAFDENKENSLVKRFNDIIKLRIQIEKMNEQIKVRKGVIEHFENE